ELIATCLEGLGAVETAQEAPLKAARLWGTAEALREAIDAPMPPLDRADYEQALAAAHTALGEEAFASAWAEGRTMTPEQALVVLGPTTPQEPPAVPQRTTLVKPPRRPP